jgi:hypothetical protein
MMFALVNIMQNFCNCIFFFIVKENAKYSILRKMRYAKCAVSCFYYAISRSNNSLPEIGRIEFIEVK